MGWLMKHPGALAAWTVCLAAAGVATPSADAGPLYVIDFNSALGLRDRSPAAIPEPTALAQAGAALAMAAATLLVRRRRAA